MVLAVKDFIRRNRFDQIDFAMALFAAIGALWWASAFIWPASEFTQIYSVEVADTKAGQDPVTVIKRGIYQSTDRARYEVDIVSVDDGVRVCFAARSVPYETSDADDGQGALVRSLSWWAYSADRECEKWITGAAPGRYFVRSRHCWRRHWWAREACNPWHKSLPFKLTPP